MKKIAVIGLALLSASSLCLAEQDLKAMNKKQITAALTNHTMTTVPVVTLNNHLVSNNPITVYFEKNGQITGQFANKPDNDPQNDQGRWEVKTNDVLCISWDHWHQAKPICVYAYDLKNSMLFVNEHTNKFETLALKDDIKSGKKLKA